MSCEQAARPRPAQRCAVERGPGALPAATLGAQPGGAGAGHQELASAGRPQGWAGQRARGGGVHGGALTPPPPARHSPPRHRRRRPASRQPASRGSPLNTCWSPPPPPLPSPASTRVRFSARVMRSTMPQAGRACLQPRREAPDMEGLSLLAFLPHSNSSNRTERQGACTPPPATPAPPTAAGRA